MKKYLVAVLALAVLFVIGIAPSHAAMFLDFSFRNVINGLNPSGIGTVTEGSTLWDIYASDGSHDVASAQITGGIITFSPGGTVTFTGTVVGQSAFTLTGHTSGFIYNTSGAFPVWSWGTMTLQAGTSIPFSGSFSVVTTSAGSSVRYVAAGTFTPVPIPPSILLLAPSAFGVMVVMRKKRKK